MSRYPFPWGLFTTLAAGLPNSKRSLVEDSKRMRGLIEPKPIVSGADNIPASGPCLIAANHYQRRGLWIAWPGAVITAVVAERRNEDPSIFWLVTGGIRLMQFRDRGPQLPGSGWIMSSVASTYGMTALPLSDLRRRVGLLLSWFDEIDKGHVLGVFPEGTRGTAVGLSEPDPRFGAMCRLASHKACPILPTGIFEDYDTLHVSFGSLLPAECGDSELVMRSIAQQLPTRLRGRFVDPTGMTGT
jgi:hypothetical protein